MNKNESFTGSVADSAFSRSRFNFHPVYSMTGKAGYLIPFMMHSDVLPGDSWDMNANFLIRSTTPVAPVMDDLFCDVAFFYVPNRLVLSRESMSADSTTGWHSWKSFIGAQDSLINTPLPTNGKLIGLQLSATNPLGGLWDYTGQALKYTVNNPTEQVVVNPFFALAYYQVWNDYYRDPNTMYPVTWQKSSSTVNGYSLITFTQNDYAGLPGFTQVNNATSMLGLACVSPFHGLYGSCLPWPQRNSAGVVLPLGGKAPIKSDDVLRSLGGSFKVSAPGQINNSPVYINTNGVTDSGGELAAETKTVAPTTGQLYKISGTSLYADLTSGTMASINDLRMGFATQRYYEALARNGNRYGEMLKSLFGVTSDLPLDTAEFLGSKRFHINIQQVNATAGGGDNPTLGTTGAFSLTNTDFQHYFTKSFTEHGTIIGVLCIRPNDTFCQGLEKMYSRLSWDDYFKPQFANIGEQPIMKDQIFLDPHGNRTDPIFGYQEAWSEYRMLPNHIAGHLRPTEDLGYWTYANNFKSAPTLLGFLDGRRFVKNVDQTLQVSSETAGFQFQISVGFDINVARAMPTYSIPGLIDHH